MIVVIDRRSNERLEAVDRSRLSWDSGDGRWVRRSSDSMQRARLAGGARRFIMHVVLRRTGRIDVRPVPHPIAPLPDTRDQKGELGDQREDGRRSPNNRA